ncbi:MAG: hypothetical protein E7658_01780 [Ruminococcaceae bacterium]|nr:hypothetical protein [Oscillospiraceae bacterium]
MPQEDRLALKKMTFSKSLRGYSCDEVDAYIEYVTDKYAQVCREYTEVRRRLATAAARESELRAEDEQAQKTRIEKYQKNCDAMVDEAKRQAARILADAEHEAKLIIRQAEDEAQNIAANAAKEGIRVQHEASRSIAAKSNLADRIVQEIDTFRKEVFAIYAEHIDALERLGKLTDEFYRQKNELADAGNADPAAIASLIRTDAGEAEPEEMTGAVMEAEAAEAEETAEEETEVKAEGLFKAAEVTVTEEEPDEDAFKEAFDEAKKAVFEEKTKKADDTLQLHIEEPAEEPEETPAEEAAEAEEFVDAAEEFIEAEEFVDAEDEFIEAEEFVDAEDEFTEAEAFVDAEELTEAEEEFEVWSGQEYTEDEDNDDALNLFDTLTEEFIEAETEDAETELTETEMVFEEPEAAIEPEESWEEEAVFTEGELTDILSEGERWEDAEEVPEEVPEEWEESAEEWAEEWTEDAGEEEGTAGIITETADEDRSFTDTTELLRTLFGDSSWQSVPDADNGLDDGNILVENSVEPVKEYGEDENDLLLADLKSIYGATDEDDEEEEESDFDEESDFEEESAAVSFVPVKRKAVRNPKDLDDLFLSGDATNSTKDISLTGEFDIIFSKEKSMRNVEEIGRQPLATPEAPTKPKKHSKF